MRVLQDDAAKQRESDAAGGGAHALAAVDLNDAARKAIPILAAGALAAVAATALCLALGIRNGLDPEQIVLIRDAFPSQSMSAFLPEPLERAQVFAFIAGAYLMSVAMLHSSRLRFLASRAGSAASPTGLRAISGQVYWTLLTIALVASLVFGQTAYGDPVRFFYLFLPAWRPRDPMLWYWTFVAAAAPVLLNTARLRRWGTGLLAAMSLVALVWLCARFSFVAPQPGLAVDLRNHHDSAVLHSVVQSAFGQIPYLDFIPQYGGYGLFARPFFWLGMDPWLTLSLFLFTCWLASFGALAAAVAIASRSWMAGSLAGIVAFWLTGDAWSWVTFYQHAPVRTLFPSLFLLLFSLYAQRPKAIAALAGLAVPVAVYWNPETGLVCFAAALCLLVVDIVAGWRRDEPSERRLCAGARPAACLAAFLAACVVGAALFEGAAFLSRGQLLSMSSMGLHAGVFMQYGLLNLPIPPLDVWLPAALVFCLLLTWPAATRTSTGDARDSALFGYFCAVLFAGLFFYYQGRSYTSNLVTFAFPLVCAGFSWLWNEGKARCEPITLRLVLVRQNAPIVAFAIAAATLTASPFLAAPFSNPLSMTVSDDDQALREFIRRESRPHETAFIVSPQAWRLHLLSGVAPPANIPPQSGLLTRAEEREALAAATPGAGYALFVDPRYFVPATRFTRTLMAQISSEWQPDKTLELPSGELTVMRPRMVLRAATPLPAVGL